MANTIITIGLLLLTALFSGISQAEVYRCVSANGSNTFQDRPCQGQTATAPLNQIKKERPFLWQATAGKGTLYLLGSIHFGTPAMYPLPTIISTTFNNADTLVVEANILDVDPLSATRLFTEKALYHDGSTLQKELNATTWQQLTAAARTFNIPIEILNKQKPWFASMTLTALALNHFGYSEALGIDRHFLKQAQGQKKIVELESLEWQLSLFEQLTPQGQVAMLEETLRELKNGKSFFESMLHAWKSGDAEALQALIDESTPNDAHAARLNQLIITDRNHSMTKVLNRLANQGGHYFVVVGAGHLTGNEGIIALLKRQGYQVSQY